MFFMYNIPRYFGAVCLGRHHLVSSICFSRFCSNVSLVNKFSSIIVILLCCLRLLQETGVRSCRVRETSILLTFLFCRFQRSTARVSLHMFFFCYSFLLFFSCSSPFNGFYIPAVYRCACIGFCSLSLLSLWTPHWCRYLSPSIIMCIICAIPDSLCLPAVCCPCILASFPRW